MNLWVFSNESIEYIYYDQLGSYYSDQPDNSLWTNERFVEEVEQVRIALGLDSSNFLPDGTILGRNPGNGIRFEIPKNLKGLII
jgi:proline iminopeptidase